MERRKLKAKYQGYMAVSLYYTDSKGKEIHVGSLKPELVVTMGDKHALSFELDQKSALNLNAQRTVGILGELPE